MNGFAKQSVRVGEWLLKFLQLQFYWIIYTLRGGVILGFLPATGTVFKIVYQWLSEPGVEIAIRPFFSDYYKQNFKGMNQLGGILTGAVGILLLDLQISKQFIHLYIVHYLLVAMLILVLGTALYAFPVFSRYELSTLGYLRQSFFFFLTNILETVAMFLGIFLISVIVTFFPILAVLGGIPLFCLPISWFAYQGIRKVELKKLEV